jgi:3D (Asp-Asp-Asp) domain-containing protein
MRVIHKLTTVLVLFTGLLTLPHHSSATKDPKVDPMSSITIDASISNKKQPVTLGLFGSETQKALVAYQKQQNLPITGKADSGTLKNLGLDQDVHTDTLKVGGKGLKVIFLQEKLVKLGKLKGPFYSGIVEHPVTSQRVIPNNLGSKKDLVSPNPKATTQIQVKATAYTSDCSGCSGITKTGIDLNQNPHEKVIAVDPNIIPLGTKVYVPGYGYAVAGDTGGAINGHHIDVHLESKHAANKWGVKTLNITVVN